MKSHLTNWVLPLHQPSLKSGDVHIWRVRLPTASAWVEKLMGLLADDEVKRAESFCFSQDRNTFIVVRGLLRVLLGVYLQIPSREIQFNYSTHGKPTVISNRSNAILNFNLSHSRELALLAFMHDQEIGIDIEYIRPEIILDKIAEQFFSAHEVASLHSLPQRLQVAAFFNCWTRKEAFIKATGQGLSRPLNQFSMSLIPGEPARLLSLNQDFQNLDSWFIHEVDVGLDYKAALAVKGTVQQLHYWDCSTLNFFK